MTNLTTRRASHTRQHPFDSTGDQAAATARRVRQRRGGEFVARAGLVARAAVYVVLTFLAFDIAAHGNSPAPTSGSGALSDVAHQPAGPVLLVLLGIGLLAYALWRLAQAIGGPGSTEHSREASAALRIGWLAIAAMYGALFAQAMSLVVSSGSSGSSGGAASGGPSSQPGPFVAEMLRWPGGPAIVGLLAAAFIGGGIGLAIWGFAHDQDKALETERMRRTARRAARATGIFGDLTRGALIGLVGVYLLTSAITDNPSHAKSLDQVLKSVAHHAGGSWLIGLAAVGLASFAVYSLFEAAYRRL